MYIYFMDTIVTMRKFLMCGAIMTAKILKQKGLTQ